MSVGVSARPVASVAGAEARTSRALMVLTLAWLAVLAVAPPASNLVWALDGLRSVRPAMAAALVVGCVALAAAARLPRVPLAAIVAALGLALAFPLREQPHLLGDTEMRFRTLIALADRGAGGWDLAAFARFLHAQPLDALVNVTLPLILARLGWSIPTAIAVIGLALFLLYAAGVRSVVAASAPADRRRSLTLALLLAGTLQAFAGYAEAWALALAVAAWWWAVLLRPLAHPRDAVRTALLWLLLLLAHRLALVLLIAQAWRGFGPALADDRRAVRRLHVGLTLAAAVLALAAAALPGGATLGRDAGDLLRSLSARDLRLTPPWDLVNLVALALPLAVIAPLAAGRDALAAFARSPRGALAFSALVPLAPLLLVFPVAPHGMGAMRDWDLVALPGLLASAGAASLLGGVPTARLERALRWLLPVLALQALGWVAVNADAGAGERRALALVDGAWAPPAEQRNHALTYLAYRAAAQRDFGTAARHFERASAILPNPRHLLLASQGWLAAGDPLAARRCLTRARALGPLPPDVERTAATVEAMLFEAARGALPPAAGR